MSDAPIAAPPGPASLAFSLATLNAQLRTALLTGGATAEIRGRIAAAETEIKAACAAIADREAAAIEARLAAQDGAAATLLGSIMDRLAAEFPAEEPNGDSSVSQQVLDQHQPLIAAAAAAVAKASDDVALARAALEAPNSALAAVMARIADLEACRAGIVQRRAYGHREADDAGRLLLIDADLEGLAGEEARARTELATTSAPHQAAMSAVAVAERELAAATQAAERDLVLARLHQLDAAMRETIERLHCIVPPGGRPVWGATKALWTTLRTLAAQRGEL